MSFILNTWVQKSSFLMAHQQRTGYIYNSTTTSCRKYTSCTAFGFGSGWTSRQPPWSTIRCQAWLWLSWALTVSCRLKKVIVSCILLALGRPTATLGTNVSRLLAEVCGTAFQLVSGKVQMDISYFGTVRCPVKKVYLVWEKFHTKNLKS